jgi:hypothetical protein
MSAPIHFRKRRGILDLENSGMSFTAEVLEGFFLNLSYNVGEPASKSRSTKRRNQSIPSGVFDDSDEEYLESASVSSLRGKLTAPGHSHHKRNEVSEGDRGRNSGNYDTDQVVGNKGDDFRLSPDPFDEREPVVERNAIGMVIRDPMETEDDEDEASAQPEASESQVVEAIVIEQSGIPTLHRLEPLSQSSQRATNDHQVDLEEHEGTAPGEPQDSQSMFESSQRKTEAKYGIAEEPYSKPVHVPDFHVALMVFATAADLSIKQYQVLREVLQLASLETIKSLPASLQTLKTRCRKNMPLQRIRSYPIEVQLPKLRPQSISPGTAYRFEVTEYCQRWLSNPAILRDMHFGLGIITNSRKEFYHANAWMGSVRTTSGQFVYLHHQATEESGASKVHGHQEPLLPSDCVTFITAEGENQIGRVYGVGMMEETGRHAALIQRLLPITTLPSGWSHHWSQLIQEAAKLSAKVTPLPPKSWIKEDLLLPELVLMEDDELVIPIESILDKKYVYFLDYVEPPKDLLPQPPTYCVRYIAYQRAGYKIRLIEQRHRLPAERELIFYGRQHVMNTFVHSAKRRISIPLSIFLDAFGLYRNAYCSIEGMYMTPACLNEGARTKLQNWFVLMYGPFGVQVQDMIKLLDDEFPALERGLTIKLEDTGEEVILTCFPLCVTGDMPQQNANAGIKSHKASRGCRYCMVSDEDRVDLDYPVEAHGRYSQLMSAIHQESQRMKRGKGLELLNKYGMLEKGSSFASTFPLLDPHTCFPNDAMHCELRLAKYFHEALKEEIFTTAGTDAYSAAWETMNVPYGW